MNKRACFTAVAVAFLSCVAPRARAVVIVAEDFLYNEPTKALFDFAGFTRASYGGGQNGPGGLWDDRWTSIGGTLIIGTDNPPAPYDVNPHTAVVTEVATAASLTRPFLSSAGSNTIYFGADFKLDDVTTPQISAEYGILSPANNLPVPSLSMGVTDSMGGTAPTFFAKIGGTTITGDAVADPDDALPEGVYVRLIGKLEMNAGGFNSGDFNEDGWADGSDFLLWQRTLGANVAPNSGADGNGDGVVNAADLTVWRGLYGQNQNERLTVYYRPTGVETTAATVLTVSGPLVNDFDNGSLAKVVSLVGLANVGDNGRPHYIDNIAVGTTWADVATVDVPRLTLEVNPANGNVRLINNSSTSFNLAYYEILSAEGALQTVQWNSLDDQNLSGGAWVENSPTSSQLIESQFSGSTLIAGGGGVLNLGAAFTPGGAQTLVARWGTKEGFDGFLNLANVVYVAAAGGAVPEPAGWTLLVIAAAALRRRPSGRQTGVS